MKTSIRNPLVSRRLSQVLFTVVSLALASVATGCTPMLTRTTDVKAPLALHAGERVAVQPFSMEGAKFPAKTDDWYKGWELDLPTKMAEAIATQLNAAGFQAKTASPDEKPEADLVIRGHYLTIEAGKKGARVAAMFIPYSGDLGKSLVIFEGDVVDKSGAVVMTFYHKEVPPQSWMSDATGTFGSALDQTAKRFANEFEDRLAK